MVYYMSINEGFRVLVDSLYFNTIALSLIERLLEKDKKLQESFQRDHLYEALIDFMQWSNANKEMKTLKSKELV